MHYLGDREDIQNPYFTGVEIGPNSNIQGGSVGSYTRIQSRGSLVQNANMYSGGSIQLSSHNTITGNISAANSNKITGTILSAGFDAKITGNVDANGNIVINGNGKVSGKVTHPAGTTYTGPLPGGGNITGTPALPVLPAMPAITNFPAFGSTNITASGTIIPGEYGDLALPGNKTLTLSGTGVYVFKSVRNSGSLNNLVFDFKNDPSGTIKIYIDGDADFYKVNAALVNGGSASRIYTEVHGNGSTCSDKSTAFKITSNVLGTASKWLGTVWAPNGAINIGPALCKTDITGALWSATRVTIDCNIALVYAPFLSQQNTSIFPYYPPPANGKTNELLGPELDALANNPGIKDTSRNIFIIDNGTVMMGFISTCW